MNVFILASCLRTELWPYTELVFDTLRIGFPTAVITVCLNKPSQEMYDKMDGLETRCMAAGFHCQKVGTIHHDWIEGLVKEQTRPFFVLDTDVIFYGNFEQFTFDGPLDGWRIPEWRDEFSGAMTRSRLHTSLLYIDPVKVKEKVDTFWRKVADTPFTPKANLFSPLVLPFKGEPYFYDTCSLLYHAIGGNSFQPQHKNCYFHMNFGTISHLVLPRLKEGNHLQELRDQILNNPALGIGRWREQQKWYEQRQF